MRKEVEHEHYSCLNRFSNQEFHITSDRNADIEKRQIIEENQVTLSRHSTTRVCFTPKKRVTSEM